MAKPRKYKGHIINPEGEFFLIYTMEEWKYGADYRYAEHEAGSMEEAEEFINDIEN